MPVTEETVKRLGLLPFMLRNAGISAEVLRHRMLRGATLWEALAGPRKRGRKPHTPEAEGRHVMPPGTYVGLAKECRERGVPFYAVFARISRGWDRERAMSTPVRVYRKRRP